jgi:hypothetical protein
MGAARYAFVALVAALAPVACVHERIVYVVKKIPGPAATCACAPAPAAAAAPASRTCGQLRLDRESLRARGKGDRHPDVVAVEARLAECKDSAPSRADCDAARADLAELQKRGYGPMHPDVRAKQAEVALCP